MNFTFVNNEDTPQVLCILASEIGFESIVFADLKI